MENIIELIRQAAENIPNNNLKVNIEFEGNEDLLFELIGNSYERRLIVAAALIVNELKDNYESTF